MVAVLSMVLAASPLTAPPGPSAAGYRAAQDEVATPAVEPHPALALDKLLHASISANLVLGVASLAHLCGMPDWAAVAIGAGVSLTLGILREVFGNRDPMDMVANGVGIAAGVVTATILLGGTF